MLGWTPGWRFDFEGSGFAHGGLAMGPTGELIAADADGTVLLVLDRDGSVLRRIDSGVTEAHGLSTVSIAGRPTILVADPGFRLVVAGGASTKVGPGTGVVIGLDAATGDRSLELEPPPAWLYRDDPYRPTYAASDADVGGDHIWVADGYGASLIHRYALDGSYQITLTGESGAGRFGCPHAFHLDARGGEPQLYVADRNNARIQVFDLHGRFERSFGVPDLTSPSGFAQLDDAHLVIAELRSRLVIVDEDDAVRWIVGADDAAPDRPGWPNRLDATGALVAPGTIPDGVFNSPHAIVSDRVGSLYVTEFLLGGRLSKLTWHAGERPRDRAA